MAAVLLAPKVAGELAAIDDPFLINSIAVTSTQLELIALLPLAVVTLGALVLVALTVCSEKVGDTRGGDWSPPLTGVTPGLAEPTTRPAQGKVKRGRA